MSACHATLDIPLYSFRVPEWIRSLRKEAETSRVGTLMIWVGQTLMLSVVCLGYAAETLLLGSPDGRLFLAPRKEVAGALQTRPPWEVCQLSFGSLMPYVS